MLRYFYLLCILLAIKCTICYEYISDHNLKRKHERRLSKNNKGQFHKPKVDGKHVKEKGQENAMFEDKDPLAQIDVASFIQKPDEYAVDNNFLYEAETKKSDTNINSYNEYGSQSEYNTKEDVVKRSNKRPYYLSSGGDKPLDLGSNPFPYKDTINSRHLNLDSPSLHGLNNGKIVRNMGGGAAGSYERALYDADSDIVHNPEKKCAIKEMIKMPFFFHNKSDIAKLRKEKKRKLFCFNCFNKKNKELKSSEHLADVHDMKVAPKKENIETLPKASITDSEERLEQQPKQVVRDKRDEWLGNRERQLKELEEIQRKVDSVEILPRYGKLPEGYN